MSGTPARKVLSKYELLERENLAGIVNGTYEGGTQFKMAGIGHYTARGPRGRFCW